MYNKEKTENITTYKSTLFKLAFFRCIQLVWHLIFIFISMVASRKEKNKEIASLEIMQIVEKLLLFPNKIK